MPAAAILLSALIGGACGAAPARLTRRRMGRADLLAGLGPAALVWLWALCIYAKPGLAVNFGVFRLLAVCGMTLWLCGCVLAWRLTRRALPRAAVLLAAALGAEVFVCNLNWFATHEYEAVDLTPYLQQGTLTLDDEHDTLTFDGLNLPIYNLRLDGLQYTGTAPSTEDPLMLVTVSAADEAGEAAHDCGVWQAAVNAPRSLTRTLDLTGSVRSLTLTAAGYSGEYRQYPLSYTLTGVTANVPRPLDVSPLRALVLYAVLLAVWALRPASRLWRVGALDCPRLYRPAACVCALALCALAAAAPFADRFSSGVATARYNTPSWDGKSLVTFTKHIDAEQTDTAAQYGALAHSLLNGRFDLELDPPAALTELENPYDTAARAAAAPDALWDVAYYNGRYYVYFGIVPCLLCQLPFEALTGVRDLPPCFGMIAAAWLYVLAAFGLVRQSARRWFPHASAAACLLAAVGIAGGAQVYYLLLRPSVYECAILFGTAFVLLALWQWQAAANAASPRGALPHLALGSLCMALVAGCRPQMEAFALLAVPLLYPLFAAHKGLRTRLGRGMAAAFALPVLAAAAGLMAYNAARFGSPFDFGASYNLTSNDMTVRGLTVGRLAPALFTFFLQLPAVQAVFPYLSGARMQTNYLGLTVTEISYGGALVCLPFLWALALAPALRRSLGRRRGLRAVVCMAAVLAVLLAALDCELAGVLYRYQSDFLPVLLAAAALLWLLAEQTAARPAYAALRAPLRAAFGLTTAACLVYNACVYFTAEPGLVGQVPALYQNVSRLVQFWL